MKLNKVGIIGANGYLGSAIKSMFLKSNVGVLVINRNEPFDINDESVQVIIDASFPRKISPTISKRYLNDLCERLLFSKNHNIPYLYLASFSSKSQNPKSKYGSLKKEAELLVCQSGATNLRLGIVTSLMNPGGRFKMVVKLVKFTPFLVLPSENWSLVKWTKLESVLEFFAKFESSNWNELPTEIVSGELSLNEFVRLVANSIGLKRRYFSLSSTGTRIMYRLIELVPFSLLDSLKSVSAPIDLTTNEKFERKTYRYSDLGC